jgi:CRP-like cAMP-binding protein
MLDELFKNKKTIALDKGKIIVYEGHAANKVYRISQGYVKVYTVVGANIQRILFIYQPGDIFPLTTILSGQKVARFFYETLSPTTLQYITPKQLEANLRNNLELGEVILQYTSLLEKQFLERVNNMVSSKDSLSKVKTLLNLLCEKAGSKANLGTIALPLTPSTIASMSGITIKEALQQLEFLESLNIISSNDGIVIDKQKLKKLKTT